MPNFDHARTVFITTRKIVDQVFDIDGVDVFSRRDFRQRQCQFARALRTEARDAATGQIGYSGIQSDGRSGRHYGDNNTSQALMVAIALATILTKLESGILRFQY